VPAVLFLDDPSLDEALEREAPAAAENGRVAELADGLARDTPAADELLASAAEAVWSDAVRARVAQATDLACDEERLAETLAYRGALRRLARHPSVTAVLREFEPVLAAVDDADDRVEYALSLTRLAVPALRIDVAEEKDQGYRYVASYPPEGSEGVDIAGKAAKWLARKLTLEGNEPRIAMRRHLGLLAQEHAVALPVTAQTLRALLAEPPAERPDADRLFVALTRSLVLEALVERGPPW
jgi:hypothetical protein